MSCPSHETLQAFLEGNLSEQNSDELADHLSDCAPCAQALTELKVQDPLLEMAHALQGKNMVGQGNAGVENLIERMRRLLSGTATDDARSTPMAGETFPDGTTPAVEWPSIPGFEILGFIDKGGMGKVYKARHLALGKVMALKLCTRAQVSPAMLARFRQEMQAVGGLNHVHIVQAHDADITAGGVPYLAMEYLEGCDLSKLIEQKRKLPVAEACDYIRQAAVGLQHAHGKNMIHRDLKPANLFLTKDRIVKILDFGLARLREGAAIPTANPYVPDEDPLAQSLTKGGLGTPEYMAPEQWRQPHDVDIRADLYSLGCSLYHLLAGKPPFEGNALQQRTAHLEKAPAPLRQLRPDVPAALSALVDRLLAKDPAKRPSTPAEVVAALEPFTRPSAWTKIWVRAAAACFALLLLLGGVIYVATDRGTVVVKTDDPDIEVAVKQNGRLIVVLDKKSGQEFSLHSGTYDLELQKGKQGLRLKSDRLVLYRGDKKIVEAYLERPTGWVKKKPPIVPASGLMAAVINEQIYVIGGFAGSTSLGVVQVYDPNKDTWTPGKSHIPPTKPGDHGRYSGAVVANNGKLFILGGWRVLDRLPTDTFHIFDPAKDTKGGGDNREPWSLGPPLLKRSGMSVAGIIAGKLYVLTGLDGTDGYHKHFHVHVLGTKEWRPLDAPPNWHVGGTGGVINGKFYVAGGLDSKAVPTAHLDVYDPATEKWTTKRPMRLARTDVGGVVHDGKLYVLGGADRKGNTFDAVEVYDPSTDSWNSLPPLSTPRQLLAVAAVGKTLYAMSGWSGEALLGSTEALDLAFPPPMSK